MAKKIQKKVLNYRVIIEKEYYDDGAPVYVTQVPTLGISDYGATLDEALRNTESLMKFHIESLIAESDHVPAPDDDTQIFVTTSKVEVQPTKRLVFA